MGPQRKTLHEDASKSPKASVRGPFRLSPETTVRSPSKTQHAKVLKFNDQPEVQTFEIAVLEPNTDLKCPCESSVLHVLDQPLPAPGELDIDVSDRRCSHCVRSRSTIHHRRMKEGDSSPQDHKLLLVQADFFFVGVANYKYLLLTDAGTGLIGVAPYGMNVDHTLAECQRYFQQLGVSEQSTMNIEVLTDSERALGTLLKKLGNPLVIKTAAPQSHQSVGLGERSVRRIKEMLSCLRSDLRSHGFDIVENEEGFGKMLQYITQTHNHFGLGDSIGRSAGLEHRRSPVELVLQKDRPKPMTIRMEKVPESLIELVPERSRFIPSAYLHIKANSLAHDVVSTKIAGKEHTFQAEVKVLDKLLWDANLAPSVLQDLGKPIDAPALDDGMHPAKPLDDEVRAEEALPSTGPPRPWVLEHGPTPNCGACNSVSRHGRKLSAACCRRYRAWVESERKRMSEPIHKPLESESSPDVKSDHPTGRVWYSSKQPPAF